MDMSPEVRLLENNAYATTGEERHDDDMDADGDNDEDNADRNNTRPTTSAFV